MRILIALCVLLSTFANASEIRSRDILDDKFISVMKTGEDQFSFASCNIVEPTNCSWIGIKDFYTKEEILKTSKKLRKRGAIILSSEILGITYLSAVALDQAIRLGGRGALAGLVGALFGAADGLGILTVTGAVALAVGVPTASIIATKKVNFLNSSYPKQLSKALIAITHGQEQIIIKARSMDYIAKLLGVTLDK